MTQSADYNIVILMADKGAERRKFARLDIALTVSYMVEDPQGQISEYAEAMSADISAGGIRMMTPGPLKNGSKLDMQIFLGGHAEDKIAAKGEVVWQTQVSPTSYETGITIQHMGNEDKTRLMEFVFDQLSLVIGLRKTP